MAYSEPLKGNLCKNSKTAKAPSETYGANVTGTN